MLRSTSVKSVFRPNEGWVEESLKKIHAVRNIKFYPDLTKAGLTKEIMSQISKVGTRFTNEF